MAAPRVVAALAASAGRTMPVRAVSHAARAGAAPEAEATWADLASSELETGRAAVERLVDHPDSAEAILKAKFAPPVAAQPGGVRKAGPEIPVSANDLRAVRAIEVLERIGTPTARNLLAAWRDPTRDSRLAAEAAAALDRLGPPSSDRPRH